MGSVEWTADNVSERTLAGGSREAGTLTSGPSGGPAPWGPSSQPRQSLPLPAAMCQPALASDG